MLGGHSALRSLSDLSSFAALARIGLGLRLPDRLCVKPMDLLYLQPGMDFYRHFDRFVWLARDPRDSYLSAIESGYAYLFWPRGRREAGIDVGLLERWRRIYRHYFEHPSHWYRLRYEDLVARPDPTLRALLAHLQLPYEPLYPFSRFTLLRGGDYKITRQRSISRGSRQRHCRELSAEQNAVFSSHLAAEMRELGYLEPRWPCRTAPTPARPRFRGRAEPALSREPS
jgi:hypothetical protein